MYRDAGERAPRESPSRDLVYDGFDRGRRPLGWDLLQRLVVPAVIAAVVARAFGAWAGLIALVLGTAIAWVVARYRPPPGLILRVEGGHLLVFARGRGEKRTDVSIPLIDLLDVALDTKTIRPVEPGAGAIPGMGLESRVGPDADISRIVLVRREGSEIPLSRDHLASMNATESLGKIRVFLREHGWIPADEKVAIDDDAADDLETEDDGALSSSRRAR